MTPPTRQHPLSEALTAAAVALVLVSAVELLLLRSATRSAIHIPDVPAFERPYAFMATGARYSYYLTVTLLFVTGPVIAIALWQAGGVIARYLAVLLGLFVAVAFLEKDGPLDAAVLDATTTGVVVAGAAVVGGVAGPRVALATAAFSLAFLFGALPTLSTEVSALPDGTWTFDATEATAVAFAILVPFAFRPSLSRGPLVAGAVVALLVFALLVGNRSTTTILLMWNLGLAGSLPSIAYAAAAGAIALTLAGLTADRRYLAAAGLGLLVTGGFGLHSSYQSALVLVGLSSIVASALPVLASSRTPAPASAAATAPLPGGEPA